MQFLVKNSKFIRELGEGKLVDRSCRGGEAVEKLDLYALEVSVLMFYILKFFYDAVSVQTICLSWTGRVVNWSQETVMIASFFSFSSK